MRTCRRYATIPIARGVGLTTAVIPWLLLSIPVAADAEGQEDGLVAVEQIGPSAKATGSKETIPLPPKTPSAPPDAHGQDKLVYDSAITALGRANAVSQDTSAGNANPLSSALDSTPPTTSPPPASATTTAPAGQ